MREVGYKVKKTAFLGIGTFLQIGGIVVFLALVAFFPIGTIVAFVLGFFLFLQGSAMSIFWSCSRCGERLPGKAVDICKSCQCRFVSKKEAHRAKKQAAAPSV